VPGSTRVLLKFASLEGDAHLKCRATQPLVIHAGSRPGGRGRRPFIREERSVGIIGLLVVIILIILLLRLL
jgi:hypothetical protein